MNLRFIDWIWHVRGNLPLAPEQSGDDAFDRLDSLFGQSGTSHDRTGDTLVFRKKDQAAQDKMSVFDGGMLRIEPGASGLLLRYDLTSRALLFCFLAPLLFLGIAQLTIALGIYQKASTDAASKAGKAADAKKTAAKKPDVPMNPLDKALGAPAPEPEKPDKKDPDKKDPGKKDPGKKDKAEENDEKPSPTPAYVFAGIFATLYVVGRILEDRLVRALFRKRLQDS